jgi:putative ABC transport system permease protein
VLIKFCILILKSLGRNKVRTLLTGLGITVLVSVYAIVSSVTSAVSSRINSQGSQTRLICSDRWVAPSLIPPRYFPDLAAQQGVEDWTTWNMFPCAFDGSGRVDRQGIGIATRPDNLAGMVADGDQIDPEAIQRLQQRRDGALVQSAVMKIMNWQVGQQVTVYGNQFPKTTVPLTIVGELPPGQLASFYFRQDYLQNLEPGRAVVNCVILKVRNSNDTNKVAAAISDRYARRQPALKVETESAGVARFAARAQSILSLIQLVVVVLLVDMVIILSNSISISVRERRVEMAVLKVLGFQPLHILAMVIIEAMLIGALAGAFGTGLVFSVSKLTLDGFLPVSPPTQFLIQFPVPSAVVGEGFLLGMLVGLTGSLFPALSARKVKVSDVFARIA